MDTKPTSNTIHARRRITSRSEGSRITIRSATETPRRTIGSHSRLRRRKGIHQWRRRRFVSIRSSPPELPGHCHVSRPPPSYQPAGGLGPIDPSCGVADPTIVLPSMLRHYLMSVAHLSSSLSAAADAAPQCHPHSRCYRCRPMPPLRPRISSSSSVSFPHQPLPLFPVR